MAAITRQAFDRTEPRESSKFPIKTAVPIFAAAAALSLVVGIRPWDHRQIYETKVGEQSAVTLEDGSRITLDTDTKLAVNFTRDARSIELDHGQAYFSVAHNSIRPFTVEADGTVVRATGTQFDVRRAAKGVDVTLVEGSVRVTTPKAAPTTLARGQQLQIRADKPTRLQVADTDAATAWKQGRIVLDGMPLVDAIAEVNRYTTKPVRLDVERYSSERFSGTFETGDIQSFVAAATALLPLKAVPNADGSVHLVEITTKTDASHSPT